MENPNYTMNSFLLENYTQSVTLAFYSREFESPRASFPPQCEPKYSKIGHVLAEGLKILKFHLQTR